jgi:hypothetical protein
MDMRKNNSVTFFRAFATHVGTDFTVVKIGMFFRFYGTAVTVIGAYHAYIARMLTSLVEDSNSAQAHFCALPLQLDTTGKHFYLRFFQAFKCSLGTVRSTLQADTNTRIIFFSTRRHPYLKSITRFNLFVTIFTLLNKKLPAFRYKHLFLIEKFFIFI